MAKAFDGSLSGMYHSADGDNENVQWITVDLEDNFMITKIRIVARSNMLKRSGNKYVSYAFHLRHSNFAFFSFL